MKCFAFDPSRQNGCAALIVYKCLGEKCAFFKTPGQALEGKRKRYARIASLDEMTQEYIAGKYYDGKMPWKGAGK